jgi:hypothetical protein
MLSGSVPLLGRCQHGGDPARRAVWQVAHAFSLMHYNDGDPWLDNIEQHNLSSSTAVERPCVFAAPSTNWLATPALTTQELLFDASSFYDLRFLDEQK